jgi:predicted AAA+ superfamily ATPase
VNGLVEAAKATGCRDLKIITFDSEKQIHEEGFEISVLPAWKFFIS